MTTEAPAPSVLIEPLSATRHGVELAVIAFTKGRLSPEELWAELDWAATCYGAAAQPARAAGVRARFAELNR